MTLPLERAKVVFLGTISIPNGGTDSPVIDADLYGPFESITIMAPATLTGTVTVQVGTTDAASGATFVTLQSPPGTDVAIAAGKAFSITPPNFPQFRMHSSGAEAAQRDFNVWARRSTTSTA